MFLYPPSCGIASCVGTAGMVMWRLHLMRPWCVALGQVLIWVLCPDWVEELCQLGFFIPKYFMQINCQSISHLCYCTITCKVLLNCPHSKLGPHCTVRCLILTRRDNRRRACLTLLCAKHTPLFAKLCSNCIFDINNKSSISTTIKLYFLNLFAKPY